MHLLSKCFFCNPKLYLPVTSFFMSVISRVWQNHRKWELRPWWSVTFGLGGFGYSRCTSFTRFWPHKIFPTVIALIFPSPEPLLPPRVLLTELHPNSSLGLSAVFGLPLSMLVAFPALQGCQPFSSHALNFLIRLHVFCSFSNLQYFPLNLCLVYALKIQVKYFLHDRLPPNCSVF